ncbi:MAG: SDR family oxidoreductase [Burkholderiales bacterium]|nr:SDR family oxidoreductase [Burkholderiales bacterium]
MAAAAAQSGSWRGRSAVVSGGARGQGAALVRLLLQAGAEVHVLDTLDPAAAEWQDLRGAAEAAGARLVCHRDDVADPAAWERLAAALGAGGLPLAGLVNNAGLTGPRHTVTATVLEDWDRVMAVNLRGSMLAIRALAPLMVRGAAIVNISSTVGLTGYHSAAYSCSKWALRGLTRSAAMELAPRGVRVNCVCPGVVDTAMIHDNPALLAALQNLIPMQAMATPEQVAGVVFFLLGPGAAYVSGADIAVDGGVTGAGLYWPVAQATGALAPDPRPFSFNDKETTS